MRLRAGRRLPEGKPRRNVCLAAHTLRPTMSSKPLIRQATQQFPSRTVHPCRLYGCICEKLPKRKAGSHHIAVLQDSRTRVKKPFRSSLGVVLATLAIFLATPSSQPYPKLPAYSRGCPGRTQPDCSRPGLFEANPKTKLNPQSHKLPKPLNLNKPQVVL